MFKSIKQGMKKIIPGQANTTRQQANTIQRTQKSQTKGPQRTQSSLPDSYLDTDSLFK